MTQIIDKRGRLYGYGFKNGQPVELRQDDEFELRWLNACTDARINRQNAKQKIAEAKQAEKKHARKQRMRYMVRFFAWQGIGSVVSAVLLGVAVYLGFTVGYLAAVLPVTAALLLQQEVGRRTL